MGNKEQIYGRNDMVMLDKHNKIYGSLGIVEPYVFDTKTGETIVMENPKKGKFEDVVTEFSVYGKSTQVNTTGAQLFDKRTCTSGHATDDGVIDRNGEVGEKDNIISGYIQCNEKETYVSSLNAYKWFFYNEEKRFIKSEMYKTKVTAPDMAKYLILFYSIDKVNALKYLDNIMVNVGTSSLALEPYTGGKPSPSIEYPQEIVSVGDKGEIGVSVYGGNLLKIPDFENADVKITNEKDVIIVEKKTNTEGDIYRGKGFELNLTAGKYVLDFDGFTEHSFTKEGHRVQIQLDGKPIASASYPSGSTKSFTLKKNSTIRVVIFTGYAEANKKYKIKGLRINLEKSIPFEPYKEPQTLALKTPNGLLGIPVSTGGNYTDSNGQQWVCDEKDLAREKYVQRIYITEINESMINSARLNWEKEDKISYKITTNLPAKQNQKCLSNRFVYGSYPYLVAISGKSIYLEFVDKKEMPTVEKFKQFLTDNKTTVAYILETPIEHDLTPEEVETYKALHTNYPTTVIMNDENAGMKVTYKQLESKTKVVN